MLKNYVKIAWRNLVKHRFYSLVNVIGLATGIAFAFLVGGYVWSELQVNSGIKNLKNQYIIQSNWKDPNMGYQFTTLGPLAKALKENYPSLIANYYRWDGITSNVSKGDKSFREDIAICDSTMLQMYGFKLLAGNAVTALREPFTVLLTKEKALKFFGTANVVGQTITIESFSGSKHDFMITGVLDDLPTNSVSALIDNYPNDFFVAVNNLPYFGRNMDWPNAHIAGYIELQKGVRPEDLQQPMARLLRQNAPPQVAANLTPFIISLHDFYFAANFGLVKKMLYAIAVIALFILAMAIINFINMSVSRSAARMREIGVRKVLGGLKKQLIFQFLTESVLTVFIAALFAVVIYMLTRNVFSNILGKPIPSLTDFPLYFLLFPLLFILLMGFIAGIYPAFVLASLPSVDSLKGKLSPVKERVWLRKSLIAFQFGTAMIAFIGAIIISKQINLFLKSDLGYNKDYILSAQLPRDWTPAGVNKMETLRDQFAALPDVKDVALAFEIPDGNNSNEVPLYKSGADSLHGIAAQTMETDEKYLSVYQVPLKAGAFFKGHALDSGKVVLNETAIHALGWSAAEAAIGQLVRIPGDPTVFTIIGVTHDFHFSSMQQKVAPIIFFNVHFATIYRYLSFKIKPGNVTASVNAIQKKWASLMPGAPFEYKFMDDTLARIYKSEIQLKKASYAATVLALIIVLLGVIGLISLSIQKRTKEIGIRKVLGSSVAAIITLFVKEFLWIIIVAGIIACPLAYVLMHVWLNEYAYRVAITATPFLLSIIFLVFITALLICVQTAKAALDNPVKSLRTE